MPTPSGTHSNLPQYPFPIMATSLTTKSNWRPINAQKLKEVEFLPFVQHQQHSQQNFYQSPQVESRSLHTPNSLPNKPVLSHKRVALQRKLQNLQRYNGQYQVQSHHHRSYKDHRVRKPATDDQASSKNLYSEKFLNKMRQQQLSTGTPRVSITAIQANTPNALPSKSPRRSSPRKKIAPAPASTLAAEDSYKESSKQFEVHVPTRDSYMGAVLVLPSNAATSLLNSATVNSGPAD